MDERLAHGYNGTSCYNVSGNLLRLISASGMPNRGGAPFLARFFVDTYDDGVHQQVSQARHQFYGRHLFPSFLDDIIQAYMFQNNVLARTFRTASSQVRESGVPISIRLLSDCVGREGHRRTWNRPTVPQIAMLHHDSPVSASSDIVVELSNSYARRQGSRGLRIIRHRNSHYDPLSYPLLHLNGLTRGWTYDIKMYESDRNISPSAFYSYLLHIRSSHADDYLHIHGRLFQQYITEMYCNKIEASRLEFFYFNQDKFRMAVPSDIRGGAVDTETVKLPSSYRRNRRYMIELRKDIMTQIGFSGMPSLFITFTGNTSTYSLFFLWYLFCAECLPFSLCLHYFALAYLHSIIWPSSEWEAITKHLLPHQVWSDRMDIVVRVFDEAVSGFVDYLADAQIFGKVTGWVYTLEFQKRGCPHIHLLLSLDSVYRPDPHVPSSVDKFVSAEFPSTRKSPNLRKLVADGMVHSPCHGPHATGSEPYCWEKGAKCTKRFPMPHCSETTSPAKRRFIYRRRDGYNALRKGNSSISNEYVVGYNPFLLHQFSSHINVEMCISVEVVNYITKVSVSHYIFPCLFSTNTTPSTYSYTLIFLVLTITSFISTVYRQGM